MKKFPFFTLLFLLALSQLSATIESIVFSWNPGLCIENCGQLLQKELKKVNEIESLTIDLKSGRANLKWNPQKKFSYSLLNQTIRKIGLGIHQWRLVVVGNIQKEGETLYLISSEDLTRFALISPISPNPNEMNVQHSLFNRELRPELKTELLRLLKEKETVQIEGPLFDPWRQPFDYSLIVERVTPLPPKT